MDSIFHRKQGSNIFNYPVASIETKNHSNEPTEEDDDLINKFFILVAKHRRESVNSTYIPVTDRSF